jgi:type IX secretion system PorP/SprF family membrane protein
MAAGTKKLTDKKIVQLKFYNRSLTENTSELMRKLLLLLVTVLCAQLLTAQDIHYSQFYASPLTLNPALTGLNDCNYRVGAMYRNQWSSVSAEPYQTPSISFDINNVLQRLIKKGTLSAGGLLLNDKAGAGELSNLSIMGSIAYARPVTANRKLNLSIGLQVGYTQKRLDFSKLTFENQFNGEDFDPALSNGESYNDNISYIDLNAGLYLGYAASSKTDVFLGGAAFHLLQPEEKFLNNGPENKLAMRLVGHGGVRFGLSDNLDFIPQVLFMTQAKAQEVNLGASLSYEVNDDVKIFGGAWYRLDDAVIPVIGIEYKRFRLGLSYDVNTSSLQEASNSNGGFEISLNYTGCLGGFVLDNPIFFCPRY